MALGQLKSADVDGLAHLCVAARLDRIHNEKAGAVEQHGICAETQLHGVLGDGVPQRRRTVVMTERVVDRSDQAKPFPHDGNDLAIVGIPYPLDRVVRHHRLRLEGRSAQ